MKRKNVKGMKLFLLSLMVGFVGHVYGTNYYYAKLTASTQNTAKGLVYASMTSSSSVAESSYKQSYTPYSTAEITNKDQLFTFYAYAKPVRGYAFSSWSVSGRSGGSVSPNTTTANITITTKGKENTEILGTGGETQYQEVTAIANFTDLTPFNVTYKEADVPYRVEYSYAKKISDIQMETKVWESYSVYAEAIPIETYKGDKITLSTSVTDGFQGWYKQGQGSAISSSTTCVITPETAATYYPQWTISTGNVVAVTINGVTTNYSSLMSAIEAANAATGPVVVRLLQYILHSGDIIELTHDMTIDLNGKNLYGLNGQLLRIIGGAAITLQDGAATKGKIHVIDSNPNKLYAIEVEQGSFINNGANILIENKISDSDVTDNTMSCAVYVQSAGAYTNTSGNITSTSVAHAYGVYSKGTVSLNGGTITVNSTGDKAYGIFAIAGTVAVNGATVKPTAMTDAKGIVADGNAEGTSSSVTITNATITSSATKELASAVQVIDGTVIVNGGTFSISATTGAYGAISGATSIQKRAGYPNDGKLIINDGTFTTSANTSTGTGFGVFINPSITLPGTIGYVSTIITGGKFKTTGKVKSVTNSTACGVQISGGMYNVPIQALNHITEGYYSDDITSGQTGYSDGYRYIVKEGENTAPVCKIAGVDGLEFTTLEAALGYVSNHPNDGELRIVMLKPYYMSKPGIYTLPANGGLLLPWQEGQTNYYDIASQYEIEYQLPYMYQQLTLGSGVQLNVSGKIEVGGRQYVAGQGANGAGIPTGAYGQLHLEPGCKITLLNGAVLNAWGYVTGQGEIDARNGSEVHEQFQMMDWKGGSISSVMLNSQNTDGPKVFPVSQYFIQNIEAPTTFHPGSGLYAITGVRVSGLGETLTPRANVQIIGKDAANENDRDIALFLMNPAAEQDNTWVRKYYDAEHDKQVYEVNSAASLGSMIISIEDYVMNSKDYILPVTNNIKIHLLTGEMGITQSTVLLPGAEIEIDKTATVAINSNQAIYLYDIQQWDKYIFSNVYAQRVKYSPSFCGAPSDVQRKIANANGSSALPSGAINVHGTFDVRGSIFTTTGGANIYSTVADAGTLKFSANAIAESSVYQPHPSYALKYMSVLGKEVPSSLENGYIAASCTSAKLKNEDGSYQSTVGATAGKSFCFIDMNDGHGGRWTSLTTEGCFVLDEATGIYYAKPSDYVALKNGTTQNADHTYSSMEGERLFILMNDEDEGCQWWEVTYHEASGLYYCDKNNKYYFYDEDINEWVVKMYTVSWFDWDGTPLKDEYNEEITYFLPYGTMPVFNSSKPVTRPKEKYYTYDFAGWEPELAPVTGDASYTAKFDRKDVMFTITFNWTENAVAKTHKDFLTANTMPTPPDVDMTGKEWNPAISYVTGDAIYTLQDKDPAKSSYTVTYQNRDGNTLKKSDGVTDAIYTVAFANGGVDEATPVYDGATPTIPVEDMPEDMNIEWDTENPWLPTWTSTINSDMVYVAQYKSVPKTYTITWNWADGVDAEHSTIRTTENVAYMAVPQYTYATPTKPSDDEYHYQFAGWNTDPVAADADATYTATYNAIPKDKIVDGETYNVPTSTQQTVTNLIIKDDGIVNIPSTSRINAENLIIEATNNESGQLVANANTCINPANAYFDWTMNGSTGTVNRTWYAIAVPWEVNAEEGIFIKDGRHLVLGRDFDLVWYNGEERAARGDSYACWKYVELESDKIMHPGRLYMMYFGPTGIQTVRFAKAAGAAVIYTNPINVETYTPATGVESDGNWNGIANPRTYYASLGTGASYAQVLNNGSLDDYQVNHPEGNPVYKTINLASSTFNVGKPLFVQAVNPQPVVVTKETTANIVYNAPKRERVATLPEGIDAVFAVTIGTETNHAADNLFIQVAEEDKADEYIIGQDLSKGGVAKTIPQLWVNRYNTKLSVNTQSLTNDVAEYPLTLFAPRAGEYIINTNSAHADYELYLTRDGEAIWNLSEGAYTLELPQGNTTNYGLRVSARAPQITTGIDEAVVDAKGETRKVLINGQVFIIRGEKVYSVDGQLVK